MYPEIIRVPLIVHPAEEFDAELDGGFSCDPFTTEIGPSISCPPRHRPIIVNKNLLQGLFAETPEERNRYTRKHVVTWIYGAAFEVQSANERWLFVADRMKNKEEFFDLTEKG